MAKMVEISELELKDLRHSDAMLACLEQFGVDNWEFYDEAMAEYQKIIEDEEAEDAKDTDNEMD